MSEIPDYMTRMVGHGKMSDKLVLFEGPLLKTVMINLQDRELRPRAVDYNELRSMPDYMRHMVGDVEVCARDKEHVVDGEVRRTRSPGIWILYHAICDRPQVRVKKGVTYVEPQVSAFIEKMFRVREVEEDSDLDLNDEEIVFKL